MESRERTITGSIIKQWAKCPMSVWYDLFGERERKKYTSTARTIFDRANEFEKEVLESREGVFIVDRDQPWEERVAITKRAVNAGAKLIYQPCFEFDNGNGMRLRAVPDFIEIYSTLGNFGWYRATEVKYGSEVKDDHILQLAYYTHVLSKILGCASGSVSVWLHVGGQIEVQEVRIPEEAYADVFDAIEAISWLSESLPPEQQPIVSECRSMCPWYSECLQHAVEVQDISLIHGLGPKTYEQLTERGVRKWADLVDLSLTQVRELASQIRGVSVKSMLRFQAQAGSLASGIPRVYEEYEVPDGDPAIYFDLEETENHLMWIFGRVVHFKGSEPTFEPIITQKEDDEAECEAFTSFVTYLSASPGAIVYHYANFEKLWCRRLAERHLNGDLRDWFLGYIEKFVNLQKIYGKKVILPAVNYSLKTITPLVGRLAPYLRKVEWTDEAVGAVSSAEFWRRWLATDDEMSLERAKAYNAVDCWATLQITDYLRLLKGDECE